MAGISNLVKGIIIVSLFTMFILIFVSSFITYKNPTSPLLDSKYGLSNSANLMNNTLNSFSTFSNSIKVQLEESQPSPIEFVFLIFKAAFYIPYAFLAAGVGGLANLSTILFSFLGFTGLGVIATAGLGVMFAAMIVTVVVLIVQWIRTGTGER